MLSSNDAVVPSINVFATVFVAIRDKIFFCALSPMSRARNAFSVMTEKKNTKEEEVNVNLYGISGECHSITMSL